MTNEISNKFKSRTEGVIAIVYVLFVGLLAKLSVVFLQDSLYEKFGDKATAFWVFVILPACFLVAAIFVIGGAYLIIQKTIGKDVAEDIIFRWRDRSSKMQK